MINVEGRDLNEEQEVKKQKRAFTFNSEFFPRREVNEKSTKFVSYFKNVVRK